MRGALRRAAALLALFVCLPLFGCPDYFRPRLGPPPLYVGADVLLWEGDPEAMARDLRATMADFFPGRTDQDGPRLRVVSEDAFDTAFAVMNAWTLIARDGTEQAAYAVRIWGSWRPAGTVEKAQKALEEKFSATYTKRHIQCADCESTVRPRTIHLP